MQANYHLRHASEISHQGGATLDGYWICPACRAPQSNALRCCVACGSRAAGPGGPDDHELGHALTWFLACVVGVLLSVWVMLAFETLLVGA